MSIQILLLVFGFSLLIKGATWLVDGASALAQRYNVSNLTIGLTVVAFGTSAPELAVNSFASVFNHQDIVFGNVIGSNNFNLFLILGIVGLISPLTVQSSTVWKEIPFSFLAIIIFALLVNDFIFSDLNELSRIDGLILLIMFLVFLYYVYRQLKKDQTDTIIVESSLTSIKIIIYIVLGLASLIIGGTLAVDNASKLALTLGVSEKIVGLTIVATGTSLPELTTSVVAALKKNNDIAVGNIIGSNIFNIFLILSLSSIIRPIPYDLRFNTDLLMLAGGTLFLFIAMFTGRRKKLDRWEAAILLVTFIAYTAFLIIQEI